MHRSARMLLLTLAGAVAFGIGPAAAEEDEIHVCVDESGTTVFQTDPCAEIPEREIAPSTPSPKKANARPRTQPRAEPPKRAVRQASPTKARAVPRWTKVPPARSTPPVRERTGGKQTFPTSLDGAARPASPGFGSPEQTWRTFLAMIEDGDRGGAAACLTSEARERLGPDAESFPLDELREMVGAFTRIEDRGNLGPYWAIYGVRAKRRPKWILLEETGAGQWKIAGISPE